MIGRKRFLGLAAAAVAGATMLTACAADETPAAAGSSAAPTSAVTESASASETSGEPAANESASTGAAPAAAASDAAVETAGVSTLNSTYSFLGTIVAIDREQDIYTIHEGAGTTASSDGSGEVDAVEADDCLIVDVQSGREVDDDHLAVGDTVYATISMRMTRSIPPQAQCYAIMTNLPSDGMGAAYYVVPSEVQKLENGGVRVLNQNGDMYITIPGNLQVEAFDSDDKVSVDSIRPGSRLVVWYDMVMESYPGQTTATRVMIDVDD